MKKSPSMMVVVAGAGILIAAMVFFIAEYFATPLRALRQGALSDAASVTEKTEQKEKLWLAYTNERYGFSVLSPKGMTTLEQFADDRMGEGKETPGVFFRFPEVFYRGTNLSDDTHIAVREKKNASCTPETFTREPSSQTERVMLDGTSWMMAKSEGAAAGNFYEEYIYTTGTAETCYAVSLFLHSTNIGNYPPGAVKEFDRGTIHSLFDQFLESFRVVPHGG